MSSGFLAQWQSLVSSANLDMLMTTLVSGSFIYIYMYVCMYVCVYIYIRNSSGPNTLPYGTPDVTGAQLL